MRVTRKRRLSHRLSRRLSHRNRKTMRSQQGGEDKKHACRIPYPEGFPTALKNTYGELSEEEIQLLKTQIEQIPESSFLILKIGSNDSEGVKSGIFTNAEYLGESNGSLGRDGKHYMELPFTKQLTTSDKSILINLKSTSIKNLSQIVKDLNKILPDDTNGYLLSISPIPRYSEFEYPFLPTKENNSELVNATYRMIADKIQTKHYTRAFFPLTIKGRNKEILDWFVNRPEPLILFNAMASSCYTSMKYIIDCRKLSNRDTIYMGLCDTLSSKVECDVQAPIYPNREESCKEIA